MRVLLLTPVPHYLAEPLKIEGDSFVTSMEKPEKWPGDIDFVVSFGYRHIIPQTVIDAHRGRLINIHISMLPWNRGADPNFWSWFDRTPKGVSIHAIDAGVDTGDVLAQLEVRIQSSHTLHSSYALLVSKAIGLFAIQWPKLRDYNWNPLRVCLTDGSYHQVGDKDQWMNKLPLGWNTPAWEVEQLGSASKDN